MGAKSIVTEIEKAVTFVNLTYTRPLLGLLHSSLSLDFCTLLPLPEFVHSSHSLEI
jgi:hypothetical protein